MKKNRKIAIAVLSLLSFLSLAFWGAINFCDGLSYLYTNQEVLNDIYIFFAVVALVLALYAAIIVAMFKGKKVIRTVCTFLLIVFIPVFLYSSFILSLSISILGPNGCSYTKDIVNYGKYDKDFNTLYFPDAITDDMTVVDFVYFYKYVDTDQVDIYLEVKFDNKETMDKYLTVGKNSFSKKGFITYQNPYDPQYTDIVENRWGMYSDGSLASTVHFGGDKDYKYVDMTYYSITYSYDELTIIYNLTSIGNDIEIGNKPNDAEYYPKFLQRFGVNWSSDNNFYKHVEE